MAAKWTFLLLLPLTTAAFSATATTEPNDIAPKPDFTVFGGKWGWVVEEEVGGTVITHSDPGTIRPSHVALVVLPRDWTITSDEWVREKTMESPVAKRLSQAQKDFWAEGFGVRIDIGTGNYPNHYRMDLYAVSEEDAKTTAWALLDAVATQAREHRANLERILQDLQQRQEQRRGRLAEQEKRFEEVESQYGQSKENLHPRLEDEEAAQLAKDLVFQMDKESKMLDIELAGTRAKLEIIEGYLQRQNPKNVSERLEALKIDQMIELGSLNDREKAVEQISTAEREFYSLYRERTQLQQSIPSLRRALEDDEEKIVNYTARLKHPSGRMVPPKVYKGKVMIYSL